MKKTHGLSRTPAYYAWKAMHRRCSNPTDRKYHYYGGRGIKVCERWNSFESFLADMGQPPEGMTLDRLDGDKDYEPGNCAWRTRTEQQNNLRSNRIIEHGGRRMSVSAWARELGVNVGTLNARIRLGWDDARVVTQPIQKQDHRNRIRAHLR